jgi:polyisoprenoid-binding protein YceI
MKKLMLSLFIAGSIASAYAQTFKVDTEKSIVKFNYLKEKVEGSIGGIKATITFDVNDLSKSTIEGTAEVKTLSTGNKQRDTHLQSDDYFKMGKFAQMQFKSTSFEKTETGYKMKGKLTISGTEKEVEFNFTFNNNTFEGKAAIYMNDFGVFTQKNKDDSKVLLRVTIPVTQ